MAAPDLPSHVEETVQAIARLHAEHHARATPMQRTVARMIEGAARPASLAVFLLVGIGWVGANLLLGASGHSPLDPPPFNWLQGTASVGAFFMTFLLLVAQRHEDDLADRREQLTLQLAMLNEQKVAKLITLIENLRRDDPFLANREDAEAAAMAIPSDPTDVLEALVKTEGRQGR